MSTRVPRVLRESHRGNLWLDWPVAGPSPGRSIRPFVRAAKRSANQTVWAEIAEEAADGTTCLDGTCSWCRGDAA